MSRKGALLVVVLIVALACCWQLGSGLVGGLPAPVSGEKRPFSPMSRFLWIDVPLQAIQLRDDDGGRPAAITPHEVGEWVREANAIFGRSGIRFAYDPESD